jgi:hypothetical protein
VQSAIGNIELLLAGSRDLLGSEDLDAERLKAWAAERNAIFCRLKEQNSALEGTDASAVSLLGELVAMDGKICGRVIEQQRQLAKQIAAARTARKALRHGGSSAPQMLQRAV